MKCDSNHRRQSAAEQQISSAMPSLQWPFPGPSQITRGPAETACRQDGESSSELWPEMQKCFARESRCGCTRGASAPARKKLIITNREAGGAMQLISTGKRHGCIANGGEAAIDRPRRSITAPHVLTSFDLLILLMLMMHLPRKAASGSTRT